MKTKDFEKAIAAKYGGIVIDEVKLVKGGTVRRCYGHLRNILIMWDMGGRAYTIICKGEVDANMHDRLPEEAYRRDEVWDLKFDDHAKQ